MVFNELIDLESNGFFTATWLVQNKAGKWGLWPDVDGNRNHGSDDECFVVWIDGDMDKFLLDAMTVALTRVTIEHGNLLIEPNDGDHTAIQIRYKDQVLETQSAQGFIGFKIGADSGNMAVIWFLQSLLMMRIVASGDPDLLELWKDGRETHCGKGVPGKDWTWENEDGIEVYDFSDVARWRYEKRELALDTADA